MTKIMVVEDDQSLREIYSIRLTAEGYEVCSAGDGEEALAIAVKERPDLVISDVMMPKISGFDMLDILRSTPETKNIRVIMMTALSSDDQRKRGENLGADKYLVKSQVGIEDVIAAVHEVLGGAAGAPMPAQPTPPEIPASQQMTIPQPVVAADEPMPMAPVAPTATQTVPGAPAGVSEMSMPSQQVSVPVSPVQTAPAASFQQPMSTVPAQQPAPAVPVQPIPANPVQSMPQGDINVQPVQQPTTPVTPTFPAQ